MKTENYRAPQDNGTSCAVKTKCKSCGIEIPAYFYPGNNAVRQRFFCSKKCIDKASRDKNKEKRNAKRRTQTYSLSGTCLYCGKEFKTTSRYKFKKFCSRSCANCFSGKKHGWEREKKSNAKYRLCNRAKCKEQASLNGIFGTAKVCSEVRKMAALTRLGRNISNINKDRIDLILKGKTHAAYE